MRHGDVRRAASCLTSLDETSSIRCGPARMTGGLMYSTSSIRAATFTILLSLFTASPALADTKIWTGNGADGRWSDPLNWTHFGLGPPTPVNDDSVSFDYRGN